MSVSKPWPTATPAKSNNWTYWPMRRTPNKRTPKQKHQQPRAPKRAYARVALEANQAKARANEVAKKAEAKVHATAEQKRDDTKQVVARVAQEVRKALHGLRVLRLCVQI